MVERHGDFVKLREARMSSPQTRRKGHMQEPVNNNSEPSWRERDRHRHVPNVPRSAPIAQPRPQKPIHCKHTPITQRPQPMPLDPSRSRPIEKSLQKGESLQCIGSAGRLAKSLPRNEPRATSVERLFCRLRTDRLQRSAQECATPGCADPT